MKLTLRWEEFLKKIDDYISKGKIILEKENYAKTETDFAPIKQEIKDWETMCFEFLKTSFDNENNDITNSFRYAQKARFHSGNSIKDFYQVKKETFEDFREKNNVLVYSKRILGVSDTITKPDVVNLTDRNSFTTDETLELILERLYDLYDNSYHSIPLILKGNGISLKRLHEDRELGKALEDIGYVNLTNNPSTLAQLTLEGKMYVEEKRKTYKENYDDINKSEDEINSKVDEIIKRLTNLGYGQEIIYNEIQELKGLYKTLNKKNWGQIVKGKLVDLSLAKLIENDTAKYIYEALTDHVLRLP